MTRFVSFIKSRPYKLIGITCKTNINLVLIVVVDEFKTGKSYVNTSRMTHEPYFERKLLRDPKEYNSSDTESPLMEYCYPYRLVTGLSHLRGSPSLKEWSGCSVKFITISTRERIVT